MDLIKWVCVNRLHEMIAVSTGTRNIQSGVVRDTVFYHGGECDSLFMVPFKWYGSCGGEWRDYSIRCPICGKKVNRSEERVAREPNTFLMTEANKFVPMKMYLELHKIKVGYKLQVKSYAVSMIETEGIGVYPKKAVIKESITFNVKKRQTIYRYRAGCSSTEEIEIGSPFDNTFAEKTMLRFIHLLHIHDDCRIQDIAELITILCKGVRKDFKVFHGYDIGSVYTRSYTDSIMGKMVPPVSFIAFRLLMPDIKKLPIMFIPHWSNATRRMDMSNATLLLYTDSSFFSSTFTDLNYLREKGSTVDILLRRYGLPVTTLMRRTVKEYPLHAPLLAQIQKELVQVDTSCDIFQILINKNMYFRSDMSFSDVLTLFIHHGIFKRPVADLKAFLTGSHWNIILDTANMLRQTPAALQEAIGQCSLSRLHDWLSNELYKLKNPDFELEVPAHIKRRLEMQRGRIKMFMPSTAYELRDAGKELHNCVGTYAKRSKTHHIVLMADDVGKLIACLEIYKDKLVQAKLKNNCPVYNEPSIQDEIIKWCKECRIEISTDDISKVAEETPLQNIA